MFTEATPNSMYNRGTTAHVLKKKDQLGAVPFQKATDQTRALESMHLGQHSYCHIPDANVVTKMEN